MFTRRDDGAGIDRCWPCQDDPVWRLPLYDGYREWLKSDIADMNNAPSGGLPGPASPHFSSTALSVKASIGRISTLSHGAHRQAGAPQGRRCDRIARGMGDGEGAIWGLDGKTCRIPFPLSAPFLFGGRRLWPCLKIRFQLWALLSRWRPCGKPDPASVPVRGDVAHIRLAGKVFVPHYVVPMPHRARGDIAILKTPGGDVWPLLARALNLTCSIWRAAMPGVKCPAAVGYVAADQLEKLA
jgi:hypothetical protein